MTKIIYKQYDSDIWYFNDSDKYIEHPEIIVNIDQNYLEIYDRRGSIFQRQSKIKNDEILNYIYISGKYSAYSWFCTNYLKEELKDQEEFIEISTYRNIK